jgi:hypothetical protein
MKMIRKTTLCGLLLLVLAVGSNRAGTANPQDPFGPFESVCAVVQLELAPGLETLFVQEELESDLGHAVSGYLTSQGMTAPVELGSSCFPRNISSTSKQLSLVFHLTLTDQLPPAAVTGAVIVHTLFALDLHLPHDYPTTLFACIGGDDLRTCVGTSLNDYFMRQIAPQIATRAPQIAEER